MELDASMEAHSNQSQQQQQPVVAPMISITNNEPNTQTVGSVVSGRTINRLVANSGEDSTPNYYFGSRYGDQDGRYGYDDDDDYEPYLKPHSYAHHQQKDSPNFSYPTTYEDLLDDRQGMNNSEQQFTKGEEANRSSLDGSIISDLKLDNRKSGEKLFKKDKQRRGKSPSPSSMTRYRRQSSKRGFLSKFKLTKKHESIAKLQLSILNSGFVSLKTLDRDLQTFLPRDRLTIKDFQERVKLMHKYEVLSSIEYRFASKYETYVCKHAQQETNQVKNNYKKCIPYDYNRVVLRTLPNVPDSDYVNASHVDSLLKPNAYIAAQGPNENTIEDFWRMVWEQKTFVIVMLTKVFDFIRVMCNQYWPVEVNKPERYGNLEVTLLYEEPLADFVIRTIKLTRLKNTQAKQEESTSGNEGNPTKSQDGADKRTSESSQQKDRGSVTSRAEQDDSGDLEDLTLSDEETDSSNFEEVVANDMDFGEGKKLMVRAPKYITSKARDKARRGRSLSPNRRAQGGQQISAGAGASESGVWPERRAASEIASGRSQTAAQNAALSNTTPTGNRNPAQRDLFLQPPSSRWPPINNNLFTITSPSLNSLTATSEPNTPITPRTPSSAGLDRSSATRKAVKKKRRERVKNQRAKRTQFMVPSESQLQDDDEDQEDEQNGGDTEANGSKSNERIIYQFHYNSWASHTCPFISSLLHFRRRVRICMDEIAKSGKTGPTIVHCNDGCGRTGTYLCIDANLELAEEDGLVDVYNYTRKMRQSRKFLIENLEQYKFVYDTIDEALFCGKTWFPVADLHKKLKHKSQRNPLQKKNEYLVEYEKICQMTSKFSIGDCAGGHRVENREKNRDVSTVPPDNFRPYLASFQTNDSTDYINAVFVDGYTRSKEYIVTEWPLHRTISDFWSLVYDHDCNSVILLANPPESSTYPSFLPSEKELRRKFGPVFSAEMVSYTHYQNIKSWIYTVNKKIVSLTEVIAGVKSEAKTTQVFQITCWPQGHRVPTSTNALVELMNMVERWRQRTTYGPVCVVSLNGKSRAGVYCAANVAIEQVVQHNEVDVFNAVKTVRRHRPQLIENMTEYKYCYDLILHYVLHYVQGAH